MNFQRNFQLRTLVLVGAGVAALLAIVIAAIALANRTAELNNNLTQARAARLVLTEIEISLIDAETGQRGYLLTQNPSYLSPYIAAGKRLLTDLPRLHALSDDPATVKDFDALALIAQAKLEELSRTVALTRAHDIQGALKLVRTNLGATLMQQARMRLDRQLARTEKRVQDYSSRLQNAARLLQLVTIIAGSFILVFGVAAAWLIVQNLREIMRARREVETLNAGLEARVAERTSALTRANEEIQRFAYIVSHDLRAPLVNIMGFTSELEIGADTLRRFVKNPEDVDLAKQAQTAAEDELPEAIRFIRASTGKMDHLINAILKLSREGRRNLRPESVALADLLSAAMANVQHRVEERQVQVETKGQFPTIVTDRLAVEQIFGNILDNALKYLSNDRAGHIIVEGSQRGRMVAVDISDNGRGVAQQDRERIFELFRRAGAQDQPGEGIGLAHVRALARRLGGDITLTSQIGVGSTFRIELPMDISQYTRQGAG